MAPQANLGVMSQTEEPRALPRSGRSVRRVLRSFVNARSYGFVLLLIVISYVVSVSVQSSWGPSVVAFIQIATVWFTLRTAQVRSAVRRSAFVLMALSAIAALGELGGSATGRPILFALASALYLLAPFSIVKHLSSRPAVDLETILGAIAAYLLFGMFFGFIYIEISIVQTSAPFFAGQSDTTMTQVLFFSFTTLTTTGYGNLVPYQNPGQSLAVSEMILGQLFLITAMAKIVTEWRPKGWVPDRGA